MAEFLHAEFHIGRTGRAVTSKVGRYQAALDKCRGSDLGVCVGQDQRGRTLPLQAGARTQPSCLYHPLEHGAEIISFLISKLIGEEDVKNLHHLVSVTKCGAELGQIDAATALEIALLSVMESYSADCFRACTSPEGLVCFSLTRPITYLLLADD